MNTRVNDIIVQAGGLGSRLETLTLNKLKTLVSINNLPIIFHLFKKFPKANFKIIADYKADVLEKYLKVFADLKYEIIIADKKGTASGINKALRKIINEPFMIIWSDLILSQDFIMPSSIRNFIGISKGFECRWSYINEIINKNNTITAKELIG